MLYDTGIPRIPSRFMVTKPWVGLSMHLGSALYSAYSIQLNRELQMQECKTFKSASTHLTIANELINADHRRQPQIRAKTQLNRIADAGVSDL